VPMCLVGALRSSRLWQHQAPDCQTPKRSNTPLTNPQVLRDLFQGLVSLLFSDGFVDVIE